MGTKNTQPKRFVADVLPYILWGIIGLGFLFEFFRDIHRPGDFQGYVNAGNAALSKTDIYADYLNTWPPFFALFAVPLAWIHNFSPLLIRAIWLLGIAISWWIILKLSVGLFLDKSLVFKAGGTKELSIKSYMVLIPLLFVFRFIIDDLSNIQINSYLLLGSLTVFWLVTKRKWVWVGCILALIISLKAYPIFILLFFIWKRSWPVVKWTIAFLVIWNTLPFLVFGFGSGLSYYTEWIQHRLGGPVIVQHKNQSLFAWVGGLVTDQYRGIDFKVNVLHLNVFWVKPITLFIILVFGFWPAWQSRSTLKLISNTRFKWEFALLLAAIPLLSPLAWKYYFVFLLPLHMLLWRQLIKSAKLDLLGYGYIVIVMLHLLSTDGLLPVYFSDVLEVFGCITFGTIILLFLGWRAMSKLPKTDSQI